VTADVRAWLRRLDETHQKATPGVWAQHSADCEYVIADVSVRVGDSYFDVADTYAFRKQTGAADAAAIVSDHNAVPDLIAKLTAVLDLADELELTAHDEEASRAVAMWEAADRIRAAVAAPLAGHDNEAAGGEGE
jgi:hypothetical protein